MKKEFGYFQVSQAAVIIKNNKCLILRFSSKEGKFWGLPGGRIDKDEEGAMAFERELKEEINLDKFSLLSTIDYEIFYLPQHNHAACHIVNLIECPDWDIKLSEEHLQYEWVAEEELVNYNFVWPTASKMIKNAFKYKRLLKNNEK